MRGKFENIFGFGGFEDAGWTLANLCLSVAKGHLIHVPRAVPVIL